MSRIRWLSLRGIRNFSDDEEASEMWFSRPLTLILGPNGTGKTTIIEALKFACSGEFPPNSRCGKSFIQDPSLADTKSVRGVVKAEVFDTNGNLYTVCRTIESSITVGKAGFKTLDSTLSRLDRDTNELVSITNRCANVDTELLLALGVSKPILSYVIFCHQEDINWPFEEGKKLKEKFDEIFDSTKFNKALESIMKLRTNLREDIRVLRAEKESLLGTVSEVIDRETKLEDHRNRLKDIETKIESIDTDLQPVTLQIQEMEEKNLNYRNILAECEKKKAEYDICKVQTTRLKESINEVFEGTTQELHTELRSYDQELQSAADDIKQFGRQLSTIVREESKVSTRLGKERIVLGTLRQQLLEQGAKIASRNKILCEALSAQNMDTVDSSVSEAEVRTLVKQLEGKMKELEQRAEENRVIAEEGEEKLQKELDFSRAEHSRIESEKNMKEREIHDTRLEITETRAQIEKADTAALKLSSIEEKIKEAQNRIDMLSQKMDIDAAKREMHDHVKSRDKTEATLNVLDREIASLHKQSSLRAELELHKKTLLSKQKDMEKLREKHEESIKILLDIKKEVGDIKLRDNMEKAHQQLVKETKEIAETIQAQERLLSTLETTETHNELELKKTIKEIELGKEKILALCAYEDFDEALMLQSKKVKDLQDKRGMYAHEGAAYKEYMKQLKKTDPCCPLCHRGFQKRQSVINKLLKEMENEMETHPHRLKQCEAELKSQQEKYDTMLQLKPVREKVIHLQDVELERLNGNLKKTNEKLVASHKLIIDLKARKKDPENRLAKCKEIMGDIMLWDRYIEEISKLQETIDNCEKRFTAETGIESYSSLEQVQAEREEVKISLKNVRVRIEHLQFEINGHNDAMQNAKELQNALRAEQLQLQSSLQNIGRLNDKIQELYARESFLDNSITELKEKLTAAEDEVKGGISRLEKRKKENRTKQEHERKFLLDVTQRMSGLHNVQKEVDVSLSRKIPDALKRSESNIENYQKSVDNFLHERSTLEERIRKQNEHVACQLVRKRELNSNAVLRKTQDAMKNLQMEYEMLKDRLQSMNYAGMMKTYDSMKNREEALRREKNVAKGKQEELEIAVRQYTQELSRDVYRQARKRYKTKNIELTVNEHASLDLQVYSRALDIAMLQFHEERMGTVNTIMKELWKLVYTGTDITSIKVRTEATEGVGDRRRTFNYKLVQTKHGREMDMKGRCSAGQKALASIILRLALAETFCKECGILALDEPTTNLDDENATSLAIALAKVVGVRSQRQKNFQLIVISHDEKFLLKLAHLNKDRGYYELYRNPSGYTSIMHTKHRVMVEESDGGEESDELERTELLSRKDNKNRKTEDDGNDRGQPSKKRFVFDY